MDSMVLCRCGHPSTLHDVRGCRAGRYQPCPCLFNAHGSLEAAINAVSTPVLQDAWQPARDDIA
jgi:hypothetical protein